MYINNEDDVFNTFDSSVRSKLIEADGLGNIGFSHLSFIRPPNEYDHAKVSKVSAAITTDKDDLAENDDNTENDDNVSKAAAESATASTSN